MHQCVFCVWRQGSAVLKYDDRYTSVWLWLYDIRHNKVYPYFAVCLTCCLFLLYFLLKLFNSLLSRHTFALSGSRSPQICARSASLWTFNLDMPFPTSFRHKHIFTCAPHYSPRLYLLKRVADVSHHLETACQGHVLLNCHRNSPENCSLTVLAKPTIINPHEEVES